MPAARLSQPVRSIRLLDMIAISALQDRAHSFEENRGRIWRVAYRVLGSWAEADDVVQDAYLRWHHAPVEEIRAPQAWLVATVTRIAIDRLRLRCRHGRRLKRFVLAGGPLTPTLSPRAGRGSGRHRQRVFRLRSSCNTLSLAS